jgi:hypothetical protein
MFADGLNGEYFARLAHPTCKAFGLFLKIVRRKKICDSLAERFF